MQLVHAGMAQHGTVVFAHEQTKGKGQRQKQWISNVGENIMMSVVIQPSSYFTNQQFLLSMTIAIAARQFFDSYTNGDTKIKWPNDVYWRDRKAGGILIENIVQGNNWKYAIVGLGININQKEFKGFENRAVSLKQITGKDYDAIALAKELLSHIEHALTNAAQTVYQTYQEHLYKNGKKVTFKKGARTFEGLVKGVTGEGLLKVESFMEEHFSIGEIEWLTEK